MKKAWDEKKIKEEKDGSDFPSMCMVGVHGTIMARKGEHPTCILGEYCGTYQDGALWHIVAPKSKP